MNKNCISFGVILLLKSLICIGQEKLGISNSNYSSTNSIYLNPSSSVDSKTYMQLNLIGANAFAFNNIAYLPWFSVWRVKRAEGEIEQPKISDLKIKKFVYANAGIDGLSFVISKRNYGAGAFVRARSIIDVRGIPYQLTNAFLKTNPLDDLPQEATFNLRNVKFSSMTWAEYGINLGIMYKKRQNTLITIGGNLKYINGINISYANLGHVKGYYNDSIIKIDDVSGKMRYNEAGWNSGRGLGLDAGVTYKKMLKNVDAYNAHSVQSNCEIIDYKYKIGVSLRDLGYIRFVNGTTKGGMEGSGIYKLKGQNSTDNANIEQNANLQISSGKILATLPTSLSVQFDWNFENHLYLNGTIIKNLVPHSLTGVGSPNLISICPHYEFKQFELAMPLTLQKFMYPQLGFAFRIRSFVLGVDNVFPVLFMKPKTYGVGVYFNLGISLFKNPACRHNSSRTVECPTNVLNSNKSSSKAKWWDFRKKK